MSKITLSGNASGTGTLTIASPNTDTDRTLTLPDETGTVSTQEYVGTQALGVNQTWQDVSASRAFDVTYTNTTGRPICVSVPRTDPGTNGGYARTTITVDGLVVLRAGGYITTATGNYYPGVVAIVPNGSTYEVSIADASSGVSWLELR